MEYYNEPHQYEDEKTSAHQCVVTFLMLGFVFVYAIVQAAMGVFKR